METNTNYRILATLAEVANVVVNQYTNALPGMYSAAELAKAVEGKGLREMEASFRYDEKEEIHRHDWSTLTNCENANGSVQITVDSFSCTFEPSQVFYLICKFRPLAKGEASPAEVAACASFNVLAPEGGEILATFTAPANCKAIAAAAANDEFRLIMNGIYVDPRGYLVATDGHVMNVRKIEIDHADEFAGAVIPTAAAKTIKGGDVVTVIKRDSRIYIQYSGVEVESIEGYYPRWYSVMPKNVAGGSYIKMDKKQWRAFLSTAKKMAVKPYRHLDAALSVANSVTSWRGVDNKKGIDRRAEVATLEANGDMTISVNVALLSGAAVSGDIEIRFARLGTVICLADNNGNYTLLMAIDDDTNRYNVHFADSTSINYAHVWQYQAEAEAAPAAETIEAAPTAATIEAAPTDETIEAVPAAATIEAVPTAETIEEAPAAATIEAAAAAEIIEAVPEVAEEETAATVVELPTVAESPRRARLIDMLHYIATAAACALITFIFAVQMDGSMSNTAIAAPVASVTLPEDICTPTENDAPAASVPLPEYICTPSENDAPAASVSLPEYVCTAHATKAVSHAAHATKAAAHAAHAATTATAHAAHAATTAPAATSSPVPAVPVALVALMLTSCHGI